MSNYPAQLDVLPNPGPSDYEDTVSHLAQHTNANDAIEAIQRTLGTYSGTAVLQNFVSLSGTENISNKTLGTGTKVELGSDASGDMYYSNNGTLTRLAAGTANSGKFMTTDGTTPSWATVSTTPEQPNGFLLNGKIVTSVSSNNLTVAIKTLANADPSSGDPVYVRINNVEHTITSALSVTKNAGTNWCSSGSSGLATNEVDYFVYLGYNATDGVVIGFSRIPSATIYSNFSTTSTNEKYCAISTITNAASSDSYEVVGRFNAILSATSSFNWSLPGTSVILQRPTFQTRALTYSGAISAESGTITSGSATASYIINGAQITWAVQLVITTNGSGATKLRGAYPFTPNASLRYGVGAVKTNDGTGCFGVMTTSGYAQFHTISNGYPGGDGTMIGATFVYLY